jgi:hypothetical protein
MTPMKWKPAAVATMVVTMLGMGATVWAQGNRPEDPWSVEVGIGWDNGIGGQVNSSGIGTLNNQVVVITKNSYEDVYGTGLHLRFGGGYMLNETTEARVTFTFQSLDADFIVPMGDIGVSNLYGQFSDYQSFGLDVGLRKYATLRPRLRAYGEGTIGIGFVDKIDAVLAAPGANFTTQANDFYDQSAAFTFGVNAGLLAQTEGKFGYFAQLGFRRVSGLAEVDDLIGTGLDNINDKSTRWTFPFIVGVRYQF